MGLKVLLLEDDESLTSELVAGLVEHACDVVTFADAEQGLAAAAAQRFDVFLVSTELPGGNGFELCDRLKNDPATANVQLVVMSTATHDELAETGLGTRFVVFTKPVAIRDLIASLPHRRPSSGRSPVDLRETIKNQERVVASLRADLATRSQTIDKLTTKFKELTARFSEGQGLLEKARSDHAAVVAKLEALEESHAAEIAERDRAHADETAFLERAHEEAVEAAGRRLRDSEQTLVAERATTSADSEARLLEIADLRDVMMSLERARDEAVRERDEARVVAETNAMDLAQARIDLAEETRVRSEDAQTYGARIAELEKTLADQRAAVARAATFEADLAKVNAKLADAARALEEVERNAAQQELARDAAFHDMSARRSADIDAAVDAAKAEAAAEREELLRAHEHAIKIARDKAIAQTLAVARERKKQTSS